MGETLITMWVYCLYVMKQNANADARSTETKIEMAETFKEFEDEYRTEPKHREVVYEDDDCVIIADHTGHELNEWANAVAEDRETLRQTFRALADQKMSEQTAHAVFSYADPVVFDKFDN